MLVIQAVELVFVAITLPLYILVLIVIAQAWYKKFGNLNYPIFKCCFVIGVIDVVMLINNTVFNVLPKTCLLGNFYRNMDIRFLHVYFYIAWSGALCQSLAVLSIAFNRLSTFVCADFLQKFWRQPFVNFYYLLMTVPGFGFGIIIATWPVEWEIKEGCRLVSHMRNPDGLKLFWTLGAAVLGSTSIISIVMYIISFVSLRDAASRQQHNVREYRLLVVCASNCGMQTIFACYAMCMKVFPVFMLEVDPYYAGYNLINDIYSGINPYLLIAFSTALRDRMLHFFGIHKPLRSLKDLSHSPSGFRSSRITVKQ